VGNGKYKRQIYYYLLVAFLNYLIQFGAINLLYGFLGINIYISAFVGIFVTVIVGFTLLNNWVFKEGL
jgi:putative flippase GtrA